MQFSELETIIKSGEDSRHQFKENFTNANKLAAEIVAFSNGNGGQIFIGVKDIRADETLIPNTSEKNIDALYFSSFFTEQYGNAQSDRERLRLCGQNPLC